MITCRLGVTGLKLVVNLAKMDLMKAVLDRGKLVKRAVQVHGKNGKVFTRMQWINPNEASTGNGVRRIDDPEHMKMALKHGIDKHPHFRDALKDQGVPEDVGDKGKLEHSDYWKNKGNHELYLPETKESAEHGKYELNHFPHGSKNAGPPRVSAKMKHFLSKNSINPDVNEVCDEIKSCDLSGMEFSDQFQSITKIVKDHMGEISKSIEDSIDSDPHSSKYAKVVQSSALRIVSTNPHSLVAAIHPRVARETVDKLLGKEKADERREYLRTANLTINTPIENVYSIVQDGYKASTPYDYIKKNYSEDAAKGVIQALDEVISSSDDFDTVMDTLESSHIVDGVLLDRYKAEYHSVGLDFEDPKPCYVAFNASSDENGGANPFLYGEGVLDVDPSILKDSTLTINDSFMDQRNVPKIHSMDHLSDIFILRSLHEAGNDPSLEGEVGSRGRNVPLWVHPLISGEEDIPLEIQYHNTNLGRDLVRDITPELVKTSSFVTNPKYRKIVQSLQKESKDQPTPFYQVLDKMNGYDSSGKDHKQIIDDLHRHMIDNWDHIKAHITNSIFEDKGANPEIAHLQFQAVGAIDPKNHSALSAIHPKTAKIMVDKVLGKDADKWRSDISGANLTINCPESNVDSIVSQGYEASTPDSYLRKHSSSEVNAEYHDLLNRYSDDYPTMIGKLKESKHASDFYPIVDRFEAEHKSFGRKITDPFPSYIALNPTGSPKGGASDYGSGAVKVDDSILKNSTATMADSFLDHSNIPKIHDMEHLKDAFIIKQMTDPGVDISSRKYNTGDDWHDTLGDVPLEIQYHHPNIDSEYLSKMDGETNENSTSDDKFKEFLSMLSLSDE